MMLPLLPRQSSFTRYIEIYLILLALLPVLEPARISPQFKAGSQTFNSLPSRQQWSNSNVQSVPRFSMPSSGGSGSNLNPLLSVPGMGKLRVLSVLFSGMRNTGLETTIAGEVLQRVIKTALKEFIVPYKQQMFSGLTP